MAKLKHSPYVTPVIVRNARVLCAVRGVVKIVALSDGPIPWPIGELDGKPALIVYRGLAKAMEIESPAAIAEHWGVPVAKVQAWQRALARKPDRPRIRKTVILTVVKKRPLAARVSRIRETNISKRKRAYKWAARKRAR